MAERQGREKGNGEGQRGGGFLEDKSLHLGKTIGA